MKIIDKLAWVCIQDNKVLMVRSKGKQLFYIPGGKRDPGETDQAALVREIQEELSVDLLLDTIEFLEIFEAPADGKDDAIVKITCYEAQYSGELVCAAEIEEMQWLSVAELDKCSAAAQLLVEYLCAEKRLY